MTPKKRTGCTYSYTYSYICDIDHASQRQEASSSRVTRPSTIWACIAFYKHFRPRLGLHIGSMLQQGPHTVPGLKSELILSLSHLLLLLVDLPMRTKSCRMDGLGAHLAVLVPQGVLVKVICQHLEGMLGVLLQGLLHLVYVAILCGLPQIIVAAPP